MKKVKIVKPPELTYQKTVHTLDVEVDGVVYTAYRVEDCNGADTEFADARQCSSRSTAGYRRFVLA